MKNIARLCVLIAAMLILVNPALASGPLETLKDAVDDVIEILKKPELKGPEHEEERKRAIREAVSRVFDFREMAKRSLSRYWRKLDDKQREEFVELYRGLLERTYLKRIEAYQNERIVYKGERIRDRYALVKTIVITDKQVEIPVDYKLIKREKGWMVYDVVIEGVSLVNNYRKQFKSIIRRSSYDGLVKMLRQKQN
ncbi:MAG: ABC transporter substrate-binding protein [Nitrospirae bacterium]|nr:ABC transporter substrate-binding protein [Nitrospirota bacterium]